MLLLYDSTKKIKPDLALKNLIFLFSEQTISLQFNFSISDEYWLNQSFYVN